MKFKRVLLFTIMCSMLIAVPAYAKTTSNTTFVEQEEKKIGPGFADPLDYLTPYRYATEKDVKWPSNKSGKWIEQPMDNWCYQLNGSDGKLVTNQWKLVDKQWYHFNTKGYLDSGWFYEPADEKWYYLSPNHNGTFGQALVGWHYVAPDGYAYYMDTETKAMLVGVHELGGVVYLFSDGSNGLPTGALVR